MACCLMEAINEHFLEYIPLSMYNLQLPADKLIIIVYYAEVGAHDIFNQ